MMMHPEKYTTYNWEAAGELIAPKFRMTLDEESDYRAICAVADALLPEHPNFTVADVTNYLRAHPEVVAINDNVRQKEAHEL
jgi:spore coat polysaccharide biosynthesis protein SpsF (cytidylyltransferase family)